MDLTGHSLGGSVSSLIGLTFGAPVVTFEAPAEKLAATRLHLPSPVCLGLLLLIGAVLTSLKAFDPAYHSYHTHCRPNSHGSL